MEINQHGIHYRFYCSKYKKGTTPIYSTNLKTKYVPRIGEIVQYELLLKRGEAEGLKLNDFGSVRNVTHVLNTLPETISGKPERIQNYLLVDINVKSI